jgi:hypothetical protein
MVIARLTVSGTNGICLHFRGREMNDAINWRETEIVVHMG